MVQQPKTHRNRNTSDVTVNVLHCSLIQGSNPIKFAIDSFSGGSFSSIISIMQCSFRTACYTTCGNLDWKRSCPVLPSSLSSTKTSLNPFSPTDAFLRLRCSFQMISINEQPVVKIKTYAFSWHNGDPNQRFVLSKALTFQTAFHRSLH